MADCKLCGLHFYDPTVFKEHIASPEHTARLEGASQQEKPVSISTRPLRCMCCDVTFESKSELQQHLATPEHKHHAELMRQSNVKLPCTSSASGKTAATNINSCTGYGNEVQPVVNPSSSLSLGTLPESEELTALVGKLCEEMRPFIRSEICRLLEPICAPQVNASSPPTTVPNHPVIISKDGGLYCTVCHCSVPGSGGGAEQHLLGKKHQSKL
uniref:Zinc-finger of C2H2 type n=1 Tax=Schistocephalus solidus TaxID=70667 RepID=A0A0V0J8N8_SCHSO